MGVGRLRRGSFFSLPVILVIWVILVILVILGILDILRVCCGPSGALQGAEEVPNLVIVILSFHRVLRYLRSEISTTCLLSTVTWTGSPPPPPDPADKKLQAQSEP